MHTVSCLGHGRRRRKSPTSQDKTSWKRSPREEEGEGEGEEGAEAKTLEGEGAKMQVLVAEGAKVRGERDPLQGRVNPLTKKMMM